MEIKLNYVKKAVDVMNNLNLGSFIKKRDAIIGLLELIKNLANDMGQGKSSEELKRTISDLIDDKFKIVVVGEFSRGKSTFINALLGERVLPASSRPTTTILNKILYSEKRKYRLYYRDSARYNDLDQNDFISIVAPEEPLPNDTSSEEAYVKSINEISKIAFAEIGYPSDFCMDGVEIIDTPGTNDLDAMREEITLNFIPQADAAIMLLSANQILSESEMLFLKNRIVAADIQKIFFVINFKDRLRNPQDFVKVINFATSHLKQIISEPKVYLLSSRAALTSRIKRGESPGSDINNDLAASGILDFEKALSSFLAEERGRAKLIKPITRGQKLTGELINNVNISLVILDTGISDLEATLNEIRRQALEFKELYNQLLTETKNQLRLVGEELHNQLEFGLIQIANAATKAVSNYEGPLDNKEVAQAVETTVAPLQTKLQQEIKTNQENQLRIVISSTNLKLSASWEAIENSIIEAFTENKSVSNLPVAINNVELDSMDSEVQVYSGNNDLVNTGLGALGFAGLAGIFNIGIFAIPLIIYGAQFLLSHSSAQTQSKYLAHVRVQIDKRYRDIIPDRLFAFDEQWKKIYIEKLHILESELERKLSMVIGELEQSLSKKNQDQLALKQEKNLLKTRKAKLEEILGSLDNHLLALQQSSTWLLYAEDGGKRL